MLFRSVLVPDISGLAPDISGPQTGSSGVGRIFPPKVPVRLWEPSTSFWLLDLAKTLCTGYIRPQGRKFRWGADISAQSSGANCEPSASSWFKSLAKMARAGYIRGPHRIYPVGAGYFRHNIRCMPWNHLGALLQSP